MKCDVQRVTLNASDDPYGPPLKEIDIAVIGNDVFISVYKGSADDLRDGRTKLFDVPPLSLHSLLAALGAFSDQGQTVRYRRPEPS